ncbi:MAG: hypothetical protein ABSD73_09410 [Candidatus Bathyarchaeia archaeon]
MKAEKTLIMIALLMMSLTLLADASTAKASKTVHFSNPVPASSATSHGDWSQTYGGSNDEFAYSVVQTSDGGYALAGFTDSSGAGGFDFYLVKTDSAGNQNWTQTYGGSGDDFAYSLVQTSDGGYALAGYTESFGAGYYDFYLVKTNSAGILQWSKTYGGPGDDEARSLIQTSDGGYALAGWTNSFGGGGYSFYLVKTDSTGSMLWNRTYGSAGDNQAYSVIQTSDGGYALAGYTDSSGHGGNDFYLVKTDSAGNMTWNMTYGGIGDDEAYSLIQTSDGDYALAGYTTSSSAGVDNFWLVKTNSTGAMQWSQTYGSPGDSEAYSLVQTSDGDYALGGFTDTLGAGGYDVWLVKTDSTGGVRWSQTYGGSSDDFAYSLVQTSDGGYALAGFTDSSGAGGNDFYLVKVDSTGASSSSPGLNWSSIEGYVIIAAIIIIIIAAVLLILSRVGGRKGKGKI